MLPMLAMTALSGGLSLMSGIGARNSAAKQGRLQMMEDARMDALNQERLGVVNQARERLGRELLDIEETTKVEDNSWQTTQGGVDLGAFMAAGQLAGYNPVTWLNSGALSLFANNTTQNGGAVTTTRKGHNAADAFKIMVPDAYYGQPTQIPKVPDMLEVFGNAGQAALSTFKDLYKVDQSQSFQTSLLDRQLTAMAQRQMGGGSSGSGGLYQTSYGPAVSMGGRAGGSGMLGGGGGGGDKPATDLPYPASWERGKVSVTNGHRVWRVDKDVSDAEMFEQRYGDIWQEIFGTSNVVHDTVLNATGKSIRQWGKEAGMNIGDYPSFGSWYDSALQRWPSLRRVDNYAKSLN